MNEEISVYLNRTFLHRIGLWSLSARLYLSFYIPIGAPCPNNKILQNHSSKWENELDEKFL